MVTCRVLSTFVSPDLPLFNSFASSRAL